jgi:hypothetical protein
MHTAIEKLIDIGNTATVCLDVFLHLHARGSVVHSHALALNGPLSHARRL